MIEKNNKDDGKDDDLISLKHKIVRKMMGLTVRKILLKKKIIILKNSNECHK